MSDVSDLAERLHEFLEAHLSAGAEPSVANLVRLDGGSSKENWSVDARWAGAGHELIVRQDPAEGVVANSLHAEYELLAALQDTAVPVPSTYFSDPDGQWFGRPTVVQGRVPGRADRAVLTAADPLGLGVAGRLALARGLVDVLAAIHAVPAASLEPVFGPPPADPARAALARWHAELADERVRGAGQDSRLDVAFGFLETHVPQPPTRPVLVHGDFRPANVLVQDGRIRAVLDWEFASLGDPLDDLGWHTCAVYHREHLIEDAWEVDDVLAAWSERTGLPVDPNALRFWQVFSTLRLTILAVRATRLLEEGSPMGKKVPVDRLLALLARET
ncbi:MAG: phosphotransferase family protein [Sporichthyaceae bacterium]